jgi:hypothetical protein
MKKQLVDRMIIRLRLCIAALLLVILSLFLFSFAVKRMQGDFLKQLGLTQSQANEKITGGLLDGNLDHYGIRNLKNILLNDRAQVVKDLAVYAKQYAGSDDFKKAYVQLKESNKPAPQQKVETPEQMRATLISRAKEFVQQSEESLKKATPELKKTFEQVLDGAKKNLADVQDPNNKMIRNYARNYEEMKKMMQESYQNQLAAWEKKYPANHLLYVKEKLQDYLDATADIDFNAALYEKSGKKYFVNPAYESKGNRWKLAFRAGKDAVEAGRELAKQWMQEIK